MPSAKRFTAIELTQIKAWSGEGVDAKTIGERLGRNVAAIRKHIAKMRSLSLSSPPPRPVFSPGRPEALSLHQLSILRKFISKNPFKTAKEIKEELPAFAAVHVRTIQRALKVKLDMPARRAAAKPLLTPAMVRKRIAFCRKHRSWTEDDWESVMFSDESMFRLINPRSVTVRRPTASCRYLSKFTRKTMKHPAAVMVWGCFSGRGGRGSLYFLPSNTTMNGDRYLGVLEEKLIPWMNFHRVDKFLQDGAPCHKAKKVTTFLASQPFSVMDWPGNSPDLNPIENLWSIMKRKLKEGPKLSNMAALMSNIKLIWVREVSKELCKKLARSMPSRIKQCLENGGQMTKY